MTNYAKDNREPFEIKRDSVKFSGKFANSLTLEQKYHYIICNEIIMTIAVNVVNYMQYSEAITRTAA